MFTLKKKSLKIAFHTLQRQTGQNREQTRNSCVEYRVILPFLQDIPCYRKNNWRITLLSSQNFPACSLFYPVWHCSVLLSDVTFYVQRSTWSKGKSVDSHVSEVRSSNPEAGRINNFQLIGDCPGLGFLQQTQQAQAVKEVHNQYQLTFTTGNTLWQHPKQSCVDTSALMSYDSILSPLYLKTPPNPIYWTQIPR